MVDLSKFLEIYLLEAEENIEKLNADMISYEKIYATDGNEEEKKKLLDDMMRASHTIKGSSASMGFVKTAYMTHVMEDVFDGARNKTLHLTQEILNLVFSLLDNMTVNLEEIKKNNQELDFSSDVGYLKKITGVNTVGVGKSNRNNDGSTSEQNAPQQSEAPAQTESVIQSETNNIANENEIAADTVPIKADDADKHDEVIHDITKHEIEGVAKIDYIKVPVERLDSILELVEELLIDKMKLEQYSQKIPQLKEIYNHMNLIISSMQYQVMQSRLVPVSQIFTRFPRMIRDLSLKLGKEIEFNMEDDDIELDRTIVDKLGEPLVHLLRNAADHGIDKKGQINLSAVRKGNFVLICVENVGKGLDLEKIKKAAVKRGILDQPKANAYSESDLIDLLFEPQMSTKENITEISGRGVGLNVVKEFVKTLGGRVNVEHTKDSASFIMELPLTLAIINSLLVEIDNAIFAVPIPIIERSVLVPMDDIKMMADNEVAVIDGLKVPVIRLKTLFNLDKYKLNKEQFLWQRKGIKAGVAEEKIEGQKNSVLVVMVRKEDEVIGLVVDSLLSEQEIIVKPLSPVLRDIKGFSGSTILGDGSTILILDIANLINSDKQYVQ